MRRFDSGKVTAGVIELISESFNSQVKSMANTKTVKKGFLDYYFEEKVRNNTVMIETLGKSFNGNGVYIALELASGKYGDLEIFYSVEEKNEVITKEFFEKKGAENIHLVISGSDEYRKTLAFCKVLFNDVDYPNWWIKKHDQVYVNLWHGTPLKKLGMAKEDRSIHHEGTSQRNFIMADYLLYPNEYTRDHMTEDFYLKGLSDAKVILLGYPRTGILLKKDIKSVPKTDTSEQYKIAFMPTWREGARQGEQVEEINAFFEEMESKLPESVGLYVNLHHKISEGVDLSGYTKIKWFQPDVDTYTFLSTCDCLITDYSSVMFDFAATGRKIIIYCNDLDRYSDDRGLYMKIDELPFSITQTADALVEEIKTAIYTNSINSNDTVSDEIEIFRKKFCKYDSDHNVEKLCRLVFNCEKSESDDIADNKEETWVKAENPENKAENVSIIYDECFSDNKAVSILKKYYDTCHGKNDEVYLSFKNKYLDECIDSAYPLIEKVPVLPNKGRVLLKGENKQLRKDFENEKISLKKMMRKCEDDLRYEQERLYPEINIKRIVIYETDDYEKIICFALFKCEKYLLITERMIREMKDNRIIKQSVMYFIKQGGNVFVSDSELVGSVKKSVKSRSDVIVVETAEKLAELLEGRL